MVQRWPRKFGGNDISVNTNEAVSTSSPLLALEGPLLALDVSLSSTGYCIVKASGNAVDVLTSGNVPTSSKGKDASRQTHGQRLHTIREAILALEDAYGPLGRTIARERGFSRHAASTQTIFKTHGVVEEALHAYTFVDYPPPTVKKTLTGDGKASKEAVAAAVRTWMARPISFATDDESDALAVAITHLLRTGALKSREALMRV